MENNTEYRQVLNTVSLSQVITKIRTAQASQLQQKQMVPPKK